MSSHVGHGDGGETVILVKLKDILPLAVKQQYHGLVKEKDGTSVQYREQQHELDRKHTHAVCGFHSKVEGKQSFHAYVKSVNAPAISDLKSVLRLLFQHPSTSMLLEKHIFAETEFYHVIRLLRVRIHLFIKMCNCSGFALQASRYEFTEHL